MFEFTDTIMQVTAETIQSFTTSIVAITIAAAGIAGVIAKFIQTYTHNQKVSQWAGLVAKDSNDLKQSLEATDKWILENQDKFTAGFALVNSVLSPEQRQQLQAQGVNIAQWQKELDDVKKELDTIYSTSPAVAAAKPAPTL